MNKKHLLVAASALVVGLGFNSYAFAHDSWNHDPSTSSTALNGAVAASVQAGEVDYNKASGTVGTNTIGTEGGTGLINVNQNNGANSLLQSDNTLGAVLTSGSCGCSNADNTLTANGALALSAQVAAVEGNTSYGAATVKKTDTDKGGGFHIGWFASGGGHDNSSSYSSTPVGSSNVLDGVSGIGMINVSQNNGNNSMIQSSNTAAAIIHN